MQTAAPPYRLIASCACLLAFGACSGGDDDDASAGAAAGPATGGMGTAAVPAGGASGNSVGGGAGGAMPSAGGSTAPAGSGGSGSGAGGMTVSGSGGASAGSGAGPDAGMAMMPAPGPTECDGKALPERAIASGKAPAIGPEANGLEPYWPTDSWKTKDPAMLGFDPDKLQMAVDYDTPTSSSQAVFVVRHGYVAAEKYSAGFSATQRHESYSMAKSFTSALVGIAIEAGSIPSVDEKLCKYYPQNWDCNDSSDPRSRITIKHAMNISTGLEWNEDWRSTATGVNDAYNLDLLNTALGRQAVDEPGTKMRYSTGDPALLTGVIQGATGKTALAYAKEVLFGPIGTPGITWNSDTGGHTTTYAGLGATAAEYAKFGYLYLNNGKWDGKQVVPESWVALTTHPEDPCTDWYRYLWHQNPPVRLGTQDPDCPTLFCPPTEFANLPPDAFFAEGVNGQFIFIVPSADMVIVRLANDSPGSDHWDTFAEAFLGLMLDAIE